MHVAMFATTDDGGAGRAMYRLVQGLRKYEDINLRMFVRRSSRTDSNIVVVNAHDYIIDNISETFFMKNIAAGHVMMSLMYSGIDQDYLSLLESMELIHFHWIANFVSVEAMDYLAAQGKALVWTLHDRNPMTGGCHCLYGCEGYKEHCRNCKQMQVNDYNITEDLLVEKVKYMPKNMVVVAPSQWMADCARKSSVFRNHRIEVIPNSVETRLFKPVPVKEARASLGIPADMKVVFFMAESHQQLHKGFAYLIRALQYLQRNEKVMEWTRQKKILLLSVGTADNTELGIDMVHKNMGYVRDDGLLKTIYSAADVTVIPSIEDNLPNVILESLSCDTPVVGFATGGIVDLVDNKNMGYTVPVGDSQSLADAILKVLLRTASKGICRQFAEENLSLHVQAERYHALYEEILRNPIPRVDKKYEIFSETQKVIGDYSYQLLKKLQGATRQTVNRFRVKESYCKEIVEAVIQRLEDMPDTSFAIWGRGKYAVEFLRQFEEKKQKRMPQLVGFFDRNRNENTLFEKYQLLDEKFIKDYRLDFILISSLVYEDEIYDQIKYLMKYHVQIIKMTDWF